jgi:putative transposase
LRNEYLAAENRILRPSCRHGYACPTRNESPCPKSESGWHAKRSARLHSLPNPTNLSWYRKLIAQKFDGSKHRQYPGRPPVSSEVEALVVRFFNQS